MIYKNVKTARDERVCRIVGSTGVRSLACPPVDTAQVAPGERGDVAKPTIINDDEIAAASTTSFRNSRTVANVIKCCFYLKHFRKVAF